MGTSSQESTSLAHNRDFLQKSEDEIDSDAVIRYERMDYLEVG